METTLFQPNVVVMDDPFLTALYISSVGSVPTARLPYSKDCCLHGGGGEYLSMALHVAVIDALLYLSGDVETNPGPLCEWILWSLHWSAVNRCTLGHYLKNTSFLSHI